MTYTKLRRWLRSYPAPCEAVIYVPLPRVSRAGDLPCMRSFPPEGSPFRLELHFRLVEAGSPAAPLLKGTERWVPRRRRR